MASEELQIRGSERRCEVEVGGRCESSSKSVVEVRAGDKSKLRVPCVVGIKNGSAMKVQEDQRDVFVSASNPRIRASLRSSKSTVRAYHLKSHVVEVLVLLLEGFSSSGTFRPSGHARMPFPTGAPGLLVWKSDPLDLDFARGMSIELNSMLSMKGDDRRNNFSVIGSSSGRRCRRQRRRRSVRRSDHGRKKARESDGDLNSVRKRAPRNMVRHGVPLSLENGGKVDLRQLIIDRKIDDGRGSRDEEPNEVNGGLFISSVASDNVVLDIGRLGRGSGLTEAALLLRRLEVSDRWQ